MIAKPEHGFTPHGGPFKGRSLEELVQDPEGRALVAAHIPEQGKGRQTLALAWLSWGLQREVTLDDLDQLATPGADHGGPSPAADAARRGAGSAVLRVQGLVKSFHRGIPPRRRTIEVLKGANLEIARGELVGLVGENGSGKSTLMQIVVGLLKRDSGEVDRPERLGYCPQTPMVWEKLTVSEHFELFATAYGLADEAAEQAQESLLKELQFERYRNYRVEELSGGTRQKLNLALALMHKPQLLLLDEPYSGFDWETYLRFWEMSERRRDAGMGILIVSHLLAERDRLDRIYSLVDGRTAAS